MPYTPEGIPVTSFRPTTSEVVSKTLPNGNERPMPGRVTEILQTAAMGIDDLVEGTGRRSLTETVKH
jgi:hypothetical protein